MSDDPFPLPTPLLPPPDEAIGLAADALAQPPPASLRARVLAAVGERPRTRVEPLPAVEVLASVIDDVAGLLDTLTPSDWRTPNALGDLDVKHVVAHLEGADRYLGTSLGLWPGELPADQNDHRAASQQEIDAAAERTATEVVGSWRARSQELVSKLRDMPPSAVDEPGKYHIFEAPLGSVLLARSFEVWTHGEDIRRVTGRPLAPPPPAALAAMTFAGVGLIPLSHALRNGPAAETVRVVLTGDAGGVWTFPLGPGAPPEPTTTVVMDAVDYCRLVANRVRPEDLDIEIEGDEAVAERVLAGVSMLALD